MSNDVADDDETIDTSPRAWLRNEIEDAEMQEHSAREHELHADAAYHITRAAEARAALKLIEAQAAEIANLKKERETNANELQGMAEFLRRRSRDLTLGQVTPVALAKELESLAGSIEVDLEPDDV